MSKKKKVPEYYDHVKHRKNDTTGVVIAVYARRGSTKTVDETLFDVKGDDGKIYYKTPAENWKFVRGESEYNNE